MDKTVASMDTVVSAIGVSDIEPCRGVMRDINTPLSELDVHIEEADVRMFPHALHAVNCGASRWCSYLMIYMLWSLDFTTGIY